MATNLTTNSVCSAKGLVLKMQFSKYVDKQWKGNNENDEQQSRNNVVSSLFFN